MKKFLNVLILFVIAFVLVACGGNDASDPDVIKIQFVPSNTASEIMLRTYVLERLLADEIPGKTFDISVGTDYNAVVEAMESGQVHVGFLTAQQYAYVTTERPGTAEVSCRYECSRLYWSKEYNRNGYFLCINSRYQNINL